VQHTGVIAWFAKNPVAANLLAGAIVIAGLVSLPVIRKEVFPELDLARITVSVVYRGATPEEAEEAICARIEEAVDGLTGVKRVTSIAGEGGGSVTIEVLAEADMSRVLEDVKTRVDGITTFPLETEEPVVLRAEQRRQVINVAIHGEIDERGLKHLGEQVRNELQDLPEITQAELTNVRPYEVSIEVSEQALRRFGLTFAEVADAVRRSSLDLPGGSIKTPAGEILLRTKGQAYRGQEFEQLVLLTRPDGSRVALGDVATVVDGFADTDLEARFDGKPTALVKVYRVGNQSALQIADAVKAYVARKRGTLPEGTDLTTWRDETQILRSRLELLLRNGATGFLLVVLVLALFMNLRVAFWVTLGIPISFLGAVALMPFFDISINLISGFAFIVVLGIVVDDAIIVGESIFREQKNNPNRLAASIIGSKRVTVPVIFAVLTTAVAFTPMLNTPGEDAEIWRVIPLIVIPTLLFSLVESKLVLPSHLAHSGGADPNRRPWFIARTWGRFQGFFANGLEWIGDQIYHKHLHSLLRWRYLTLATATSILLVTIGIVAGGWINSTFFPGVEGDNVMARITMPQGTPIEVTRQAVHRMEQAAEEVRTELDAEMNLEGISVAEHMFSTVGGQPYLVEQQINAGQRDAEGLSGAHLGEVNVQLIPSEIRNVSSEEFQRRWRQRTGTIPDAVELSFSSQMFTMGKDIDLQLKHADTDQLRRAANELKDALAGYQGVLDITDSFRAGKQEIELQIKPAAEVLGLTTENLARQVRQAFYGEEAQRIQRGRDDVRVMVRYPASHRRSLADLENMRIRTPDGLEVPFREVAEAKYGRGFASIRRADRSRIIRVSANVDEEVPGANADRVYANLESEVLPSLMARYPGLAYSKEGESKSRAELVSGLISGFIIAMFVIYALMAIPFKSYTQPLIIMSAIPFGLAGAIWAHLLLGIDLSIMSMFGIVALAGVVVNDSLVLVDFINRRRQEDMDLISAIRSAGVNRFRPIILTSLTTFASLTPLILEKSVQARFLIPMAVSLAFGILFATAVILVLVPCLYMVLEDIKAALKWIYFGTKTTGQKVPSS
jgi:multidrug efflux pump subunit AcrB